MWNKPMHMPEAKVWSDLFVSFTEGKGGTEKGEPLNRSGVYVGPHISISAPDGYRYGTARAVDAVYEIANRTMIHVNNDSISFRVTVRDDGSALVSLEYSQIIGSHWLTEIDASTIPAHNEAAYA